MSVTANSVTLPCSIKSKNYLLQHLEQALDLRVTLGQVHIVYPLITVQCNLNCSCEIVIRKIWGLALSLSGGAIFQNVEGALLAGDGGVVLPLGSRRLQRRRGHRRHHRARRGGQHGIKSIDDVHIF